MEHIAFQLVSYLDNKKASEMGDPIHLGMTINQETLELYLDKMDESN